MKKMTTTILPVMLLSLSGSGVYAHDGEDHSREEESRKPASSQKNKNTTGEADEVECKSCANRTSAEKSNETTKKLKEDHPTERSGDSAENSRGVSQ